MPFPETTYLVRAESPKDRPRDSLAAWFAGENEFCPTLRGARRLARTISHRIHGRAVRIELSDGTLFERVVGGRIDGTLAEGPEHQMPSHDIQRLDDKVQNVILWACIDARLDPRRLRAGDVTLDLRDGRRRSAADPVDYGPWDVRRIAIHHLDGRVLVHGPGKALDDLFGPAAPEETPK